MRIINEERFWEIIEKAWPQDERTRSYYARAFDGTLEGSDDWYETQKEMLGRLDATLEQLSCEELIAFDRILERKLYDIDRAEIHEYTDGGDDGFLYCRGFIVSMGQDFYRLVQEDPSRALVDMELEEICYLPVSIYQEKCGEWLASDISRETGSNSDGWEEAE